jgi:hypothetical protein
LPLGAKNGPQESKIVPTVFSVAAAGFDFFAFFLFVDSSVVRSSDSSTASEDGGDGEAAEAEVAAFSSAVKGSSHQHQTPIVQLDPEDKFSQLLFMRKTYFSVEFSQETFREYSDIFYNSNFTFFTITILEIFFTIL